MSTFVGKPAEPVKQKAAEPTVQEPVKADPKPEPAKPAQAQKRNDKTRAELVEEAEALGISVPKNASKAQIKKLIDEAPVM